MEIKSFDAHIDDLLDGDTPRQKYEYLKALIRENAILKGRLDFCKNQFEIIRNNEFVDETTRKWTDSVLTTLSKPI